MRTKLITLLITFVVLSLTAVTAVAWVVTRQIMRDAARSRLVTIRTDRKDEIEHHFSILRDELSLLSKDPTIVSAVQSFASAFANLENETTTAEQQGQLNEFYERDFLPNIEVNMRQELDASDYIPRTNMGVYLQAQYIANNTYPIGEKHMLDNVGDGSQYSEVHAEFHPFLRAFIELFGYYDLFLVEPVNRNIVYSVYKEVDFATSLVSGPHADSGLANVVNSVLEDLIPGEIYAVDFSAYDPSFQSPAAFFATGVFEDETLVGVLVIQVPIDELNAVMTSEAEWKERGMGNTGESYLIGPDQLMRSMSRLLIEDRGAYLAALRKAGIPVETVNRVLNLETSILLHEITTESAERALADETDIIVTTNYRNAEVLSAFAPLDIEGLDWAVITEIDTAEIDTPIESRFRVILATIGGLFVVLIIFSIYMANRYTRPIRRLAAAAREIDVDTTELVLSSSIVNARDEVGQLVTALKTALGIIDGQQKAVDRVSNENQRLMLSIMPAPIAARIKQGERNIAEEVQNVTLMFADLRGIYELGTRYNSRKREAEALNVLAERLEAASSEIGVEREPTLNNRFMAVCGLNNEEGNRVERIVAYAIRAQRIVQAFNEEFGTSLTLKIGIHTGNVLAAALETDAFRFDLWGSTVEITETLEQEAPRGSILVSHEVYLRIQHLHQFEAVEPLNLEDGRIWRAWLLIPSEEEETSMTDRFAYALAQADRSRTLPRTLKPRGRRTNKRFIQL